MTGVIQSDHVTDNSNRDPISKHKSTTLLFTQFFDGALQVLNWTQVEGGSPRPNFRLIMSPTVTNAKLAIPFSF
jgi:hypothetical protein